MSPPWTGLWPHYIKKSNYFPIIKKFNTLRNTASILTFHKTGAHMRNLVTLATLFFTTSIATADTLRGIEYYNDKDYKGAAEEFRAPASFGDPVAIRYFGHMLYIGRGVPENRGDAKKYLLYAYERGDTASGIQLADLLTDQMLHISTNETPAAKDFRLQQATHIYAATYTGPTAQKTASKIVDAFIDTNGAARPDGDMVIWYKRGVHEDHPLSAWMLSRYHLTKAHASGDYKQAFYWAEYAAFLNHPEAQTDVGDLYSKGHFGPEQPDTGIALIVQAAKQGHPRAMLHVAEYFADHNENYGMSWRMLQLAYDRGMEKTDRSSRLVELLRSKGGDTAAHTIDDYAYSGYFDTLIQKTLPAYNAARENFINRIVPYKE
jgi:TPR repeat protein